MRIPFSIALAAVAVSAIAFGQFGKQDGPYQVGYAANLNVGDSTINLTNDGNGNPIMTMFARVGPVAVGSGTSRRPKFRPRTAPGFIGNGPNLCVNTYVFDPQEEEIGCCSCLVTPNGLNSLSVQSDLISNNLTPAIPASVVIKLLGSTPGTDPNGNLTLCNPATVNNTNLVYGMMAWGSTLEPNGSPGNYGVTNVPFLSGTLSQGELDALTDVCTFIQANGSGFGICKSCRLGALGGAKQ